MDVRTINQRYGIRKRNEDKIEFSKKEIMKINEDVTLDLSTQQSEPYRASPS